MNETLLVVDDDALVLSGITADLEQEGYLVHGVASAADALAFLDQHPVDLILSDLIMPGMDGMALLEQAKKKFPDMPFIMITGHGTVGRALEALRGGAGDFIQKPAEPGIIRHRIRAQLDGAHLRKNLLQEKTREESRRRDMQKKMVRDQRMVSLGRLADGVSGYLSSVLDPVFRCASEIFHLSNDDPVKQRAQEIERAALKAMHLIRHLQTIGHSGHLRVESVDPNDVVQDFLKSPDTRWQSVNGQAIGVRYQTDPPVPPIKGSSTQLLALIENIVRHAVEGMPDGGEIILHLSHVDVEPNENTHASGHYVRLSVADRCLQPPAQDMDRMFEPFQPRLIGDQETNTGLGLSVVYRILQDHQGFIDVRHEPHSGTQYHVYLPVDNASAAATQHGEAEMLGHETILVVDDHDEHREQAASILTNLGYHVLTAESGHAALEYFTGNVTVDLVVLDLVLADAFDGLETYKKIIESHPGQRAVLVSGFAEFSRIVEARKLGLITYAQKPYALESLGKAVRKELDRDTEST